MNFQMICIGGGSIRGLCEVGALHYFYEENIISYKDIHTFAGTSIGSIIALLLSIGYTPMEILIQVIKIKNWMDFDTTSLMNFKDDGGFLDIKHIVCHIELMVRRKMHFIPTLEQLYERTGKRLVIATTNVTKQRIEHKDYSTDPDLSCIDAIQMSSSLPIIFKRFEYQDCYYVDGALLDNFPISSINDGKSKILGICVEGFNNEDKSFLNYVYILLTLPTITIQKLHISQTQENCSILNIIAKDTPALDFALGKDMKMNMFLQGYKSAEKYAIEQFWSDWKWEDV